MTTRAERRRLERDGKASMVAGITRKDLERAEDELAASEEAEESSPDTVMAALLDDWFTLDHQRESLRQQYQRTAELKKRGRSTGGLETQVQRYAETKQEIELVEAQMLETLKESEGEERERLLTANFYIPTKGVVWRVPERLRTILEDGVRGAGEGGTPAGSSSERDKMEGGAGGE